MKRQLPEPFEVEAQLAGQTLPSRSAPEAYAVWFFSFLRADLASLSLGDQYGMCANLWSFARPELVANYPDARPNFALVPPLDVVTKLQQESRAALDRLRKGGIGFQLDNGIAYGLGRSGDGLVRVDHRGTLEDFFRAAAIDTVETYWTRLRPCPVCQQVFLKLGKQKYCSKKCANRVHWQAFEEKRPKRDHHREYAERTRKRLGPKVSVKKRSTK